MGPFLAWPMSQTLLLLGHALVFVHQLMFLVQHLAYNFVESSQLLLQPLLLLLELNYRFVLVEQVTRERGMEGQVRPAITLFI